MKNKKIIKRALIGQIFDLNNTIDELEKAESITEETKQLQIKQCKEDIEEYKSVLNEI